VDLITFWIPRTLVANNRPSIHRSDGLAKGSNNPIYLGKTEPIGGPVTYEASAYIQNALQLDEPVSLQGGPGADQIDDAVSQSTNGGQLDVPMEAYDLAGDPLFCEILAGDPGKFCGDPQRPVKAVPQGVKPRLSDETHAAAPDPQIQGRIERERVLQEHIQAGHAKVCHTLTHEGGDVMTAKEEDLKIQIGAIEGEPSAVLFGFWESVARLLKDFIQLYADPAFGNGQDEALPR
jgi:hypothetical protein